MTVTAIIPALERADTIAATVEAVRSSGLVDRVVVVDDGSTDGTAEEARRAGAVVVRLPVNAGKGRAVAAGVEADPSADIYLLLDADLAATAGLAGALLDPLHAGQADMTVAVLPAAGGRGGFGLVKGLARAGIERATGWRPAAPLSGQRAVRGPLLRSLDLADRFGLETALTIDAARAGARVVEVPVAMDHRHTGRRLAGFRHRLGQGVDIVRALWPRLTSPGLRVGLVVGLLVLAVGGSLVGGARAEPSSVGPSTRPAKVVMFGMPRLEWSDLGAGRVPVLDSLIKRGAVAATSVRTLSGRPNPSEAWASVGAGARVGSDDMGGFAFDASSRLEGGTAAEALTRRTGKQPAGSVVVVGGPAVDRQNDGRSLPSTPGALGDALRAAGKRAAVVGNSDTGYRYGKRASILRPAAIAVMGSDSSVDAGDVSRDLLQADPVAPFGYRSDTDVLVSSVKQALATADVVAVDPGDLDRAAEFQPLASPAMAVEARTLALRRTDEALGEVVKAAGPDVLVLVVATLPPNGEWHLTPLVAVGPGVVHGYLHSPSTRRLGIVTLTDVAPTVLDALGVPVPDGMIGHPLRYHPGSVDLGRLARTDRDATYREATYLHLTIGYITFQAIIYLLAIIAFSRLGGPGRAATALRWIVLAISAYPLATFVFRAIPNVAATGNLGVPILFLVDAVLVAIALRFRRHALSPLTWLLAATVGLLGLDVATGARLQTSSLMGYSLHTAARFTGLGNTAFATLAASAVILGTVHVHMAPRRREALVATACLFAFVIVIDGAPSLGSDVGGILTLVPVFGLTLLVLAGRRVSWRAVFAAGAITAMVIVLAIGIDLLRPPDVRTHLGRLVAQIGHDGWGPLTTTIRRKLAANFRTYRSPWSWALVTIAVYMLYVLGWTRGWRDLLPPRTALRAGVVGTLAAGLIGYAVNDSGVVVAAVVFVYIGPFLTLLALGRDKGPVTVLQPDVDADGPRTMPRPVTAVQ